MPWSEDDAAAAQSLDLVGRTVGSYEIIGELARGGMGIIYQARHRVIGAVAALKVLRPELMVHRDLVERFVEEARAQARVRHPNTVQIFDLTVVGDGRPCIVMELVEGETLEQRIAGGPLSPEQALPVLVQICNGLGAAHAAGIVHRDVKTDNVLLMRRQGRSDFVKVLDFSIAKIDRLEAGLTVPGTVLGTPYYMAPEQALGRPVDGRADIYAVGVLAYRVLTGTFPFDGETAAEVMIKQVRDAAPQLDGVPPRLRATIQRALAKRPEDRQASMAELAQDFRACAVEADGARSAPIVLSAPTPRPAPAGFAAEFAGNVLRLSFPSLESFEKVEREQLAQGRLYIPSAKPAPAGAVELVLLVPGRAETRIAAEVATNVGAEQARAWGLEPGFAVALRRRAPVRAEPGPVSPQEIDQLVALLEARLGGDLYALLGLSGEATGEEIVAAVERLERELQRLCGGAGEAQRQRIEALSAHLDKARRTLGDPWARAIYDAPRGNFQGIARAMAAGLSSVRMQHLHRAFQSRYAQRVASVPMLVQLADQRLADGDKARALASLREALGLDPLSPELHRRYWALKRDGSARSSAPEACAAAVG